MSKTKNLIERLELYNRWRNGDDTVEMPDTVQLSDDIETAIKLLKRYDMMEDIIESAANVAKDHDDIKGTFLLEDIFLGPILKHYQDTL